MERTTAPDDHTLETTSMSLPRRGALLLAGFYLVIDAAKLTRMTVFRVYGLNALALYVGAELSFKVIFSKWQIIHPNGYSGALAGGAIAWAQDISDPALRQESLTRAGQAYFRRDPESARSWLESSQLPLEAQQQILNPPSRWRSRLPRGMPIML